MNNGVVGWGRVETIPPTLLFVDSGLAGAGVKLAASVIKEAGIKLKEDKAYEGARGSGKLKIVPYTVRQLSFGGIQEKNVAGLYDGPFPWENTFGFHLAGMVGHDFFKPYAVAREIGQKPDEVTALASSDDAKATLQSETDTARALGIFGSPTFVTGGEIFGGGRSIGRCRQLASSVDP